MVDPLVDRADVAGLFYVFRHPADGVFREKRYAVAVDELGDSVVDLGAQVVGVSREDDADAAALLELVQRVRAELLYVAIRISISLRAPRLSRILSRRR